MMRAAQFFIMFCCICLFSISLLADVKAKRKPPVKPHGDCPAKVTKKVARALITNWMQAEMWGQTKPTLAKSSCLERKNPYRLVLPGPPTDHVDLNIHLFATKWRIIRLRKAQDTKFSIDYLADIKVEGLSPRTPSSKKSQKTTSFSQKVLFSFPRGLEAKVFGCVMLHSSWEQNFIEKACLK